MTNKNKQPFNAKYLIIMALSKKLKADQGGAFLSADKVDIKNWNKELVDGKNIVTAIADVKYHAGDSALQGTWSGELKFVLLNDKTVELYNEG